MRFAIWPSAGQPWADVAAVVDHAERTGWDRAYVADHFMADGETADSDPLTPMHEATAIVPALAARTERIELATLVFGITYRHPAVLANWAATVDHVAGGRFTLGLGAGWQENEHEQYGIGLGSPGVRIDRFEEALVVLRGLLDDRETTFSGEHYRLERAIAEPKPTARMRMLIGGKGDRMMNVVARRADEWNMWALPPTITKRRAVLDAACEGAGRDPSTIRTSTQALWFLTDDEETAERLSTKVPQVSIGGPVERLVEHVAAYRDAGVDEVIVPDFTLGRGSERLERMDTIIERIASEFRPAA